MERIARLSQWIKLLLLLLALMQLGSYFIVMLMGEYHDGQYTFSIDWWGYFSSFLNVGVEAPWQALALQLHAAGWHPGWILASAEIIPYLFIYYFLYRLFSLYQQGQVFAMANFTCLTRIAMVFFIWVLLSLFYPMLVAITLRVVADVHGINLFLSLGSQELKYALVGLIFYCIAWVMKQALQLQQEADLTI